MSSSGKTIGLIVLICFACCFGVVGIVAFVVWLTLSLVAL